MYTMRVIAGDPYMHDPKLLGRLGRVRVPVLVIWGESDRIATPAYGAAYAAAFPDARFEVVEEAGHLPQIEQPDATFALIDGYTNEQSNSTGPRPSERGDSDMSEPNHAQPAAFVTAPEDAPAYWQDGALWTILASGEKTMGVFTMIDQLMPEGGPPPHAHERFCEAFYILDGEIEFQVGSDFFRARAGAAVWIPPGTPHGFRVRSETARALNMYTPGGFDDTISMLATPEQERAFLGRIRDLHTQTWTEEVPNLLAGEDGG